MTRSIRLTFLCTFPASKRVKSSKSASKARQKLVKSSSIHHSYGEELEVIAMLALRPLLCPRLPPSRRPPRNERRRTSSASLPDEITHRTDEKLMSLFFFRERSRNRALATLLYANAIFRVWTVDVESRGRSRRCNAFFSVRTTPRIRL